MINESEVNEAKYFAIGAHGEQKRRYTGEPYWTHLDDVVKILRANTYCSTVMLQAAWLHDVVEDTAFTIFDINEFFGSHVCEYVNALTEPYRHNRTARKAAYNEIIADSHPEVQTIKYADIISNTSSIVELDPDFAKIYLLEKQELLSMANKGCGILYEMAWNYCGGQL